MTRVAGLSRWDKQIWRVHSEGPEDKPLGLDQHRERREATPKHLSCLVKSLLCGWFTSTRESDSGWAIGCGGA
jgi:hypothetical protein